MEKLGDPRLRADGYGMVAAQREREITCLQGLVDTLRYFLRGLSNFLQVFRSPVTKVLLLRQPDMNVSGVLHLMPQALQRVVKPRGAHRRRAHIHPPAFLPQVEGNAQNANLHRPAPRTECVTTTCQ